MVSQNCIRCILKGGGKKPRLHVWDSESWAMRLSPFQMSMHRVWFFSITPACRSFFFFHPLEAGFTRYGSRDTIPTSFLDCCNLSMHHGNRVKRQRNLRNWISSGLSNIDTVWLPLLFIIIIIIISKKEKITQAEHCLMGTDVNVSEWLSSDW